MPTDADLKMTRADRLWFAGVVLVGMLLWAGFVFAAEPETWRLAAAEGKPITLTTTTRVRYGVDGAYLEREFPASTITCSNATFGRDPKANVVKHCDTPVLPVIAQGCGMFSATAVNFRVTTWPAGRVAFMTSQDPAAAFFVTWWCAGKYRYTTQSLVGYRDDIPDGFLDIASWFYTASEAERAAKVREQSKCPVGADRKLAACVRYDSLFPIARQQLAFSNPPPIVWKVAVNAKALDRPVYPSTAGKRSTKVAKERAIVGDACGCIDLAIEEGASTYCAIPGSAPTTQVTLCTR